MLLLSISEIRANKLDKKLIINGIRLGSLVNMTDLIIPVIMTTALPKYH